MRNHIGLPIEGVILQYIGYVWISCLVMTAKYYCKVGLLPSNAFLALHQRAIRCSISCRLRLTLPIIKLIYLPSAQVYRSLQCWNQFTSSDIISKLRKPKQYCSLYRPASCIIGLYDTGIKDDKLLLGLAEKLQWLNWITVFVFSSFRFLFRFLLLSLMIIIIPTIIMWSECVWIVLS